MAQGGISLAPPLELAPKDRRVPPMLHSAMQRAMASCSKGAWGLFVLSRGLGILTETAISPSTWSRQCPSRYAIRAGRNLPDKEFRYLRTVIVTAAVYRGFGSELRGLPPLPLPLTFRHRAGVSAYTAPYAAWHAPVFLLNSRLGRFSAVPASGHRKGDNRPGHPFFRSYGIIMPSSLTTSHSFT